MDVTTITTRDDLLLELGETLGGQASVHPVESVAAALEHLSLAKRGHVLLIDTRDVPDVRGEIQRVDVQAPHAVVLVLAPAETEKEVAAALKGSKAFAVLPIPLDKRKVEAVLEAAVADARDRKSARASESAGSPDRRGAAEPRHPSDHPRAWDHGATVSVEPFQPHGNPSATADDTPLRKVRLWAGAAVAAAAVAGIAYLVFGGSHAPVAPPAAKSAATPAARGGQSSVAAAAAIPQPVVETSLLQGKLDDLLEKGRLAMRERRYSEPPGDNALLYYRSAAAVDASSGEAADGLQRVAELLASRFDDATSGNRYDEAAVALANFKLASPRDPRIGSFELRLTTAQFSRALADGNLERAAALVRAAQQSAAVPADQIARWRAELTRRQEDTKVQRLAGLVGERLRDSKLIEPANDSARDYLQQLREQAPTSSLVPRLSHDLNVAYLRKAREATIANHPAEADRWLSEAKAGGLTASEINSYQRELATARQKAAAAESDRLAQLARDRLREGRLTDPAQDSAAYYLGQLQSADAGNPALLPVSRDLAGKLIERARLTVQGGGSAEADLALARRFGADPKDILAVQQIQNAPKGTAGSARAPSAADLAALAANIKRLRYVAPDYPQKALSENLSGAVTVEYTVDTKGDVRDVRVIESTPPGVFDHAAVAAIKRWRYQPAVMDGSPVEVPIRTSVRFELPK